MLDDDPFAPPPRKPVSLESWIETASINDLEARIVQMQAEIQQFERAIAAKRAQRAAADSVFGARPT